MEEKPKLINGGIAVDDRGEVCFANEFDFKGVKRFYMIANHKSGFVRAWHAHKREAKYMIAVSGAAIIGAVKIDNWESPSKDLKPESFVLSAKKPQVLFIPAGYANGIMSLTDDAKVMVFSCSTLEESLNDDFRIDSRHWDIWNIIER
jgi:dTDP-4-dehydrorhamnose 3,5-epimerase